MVELAPEISLRPLPLSGDDASNRTSQNLLEAEDKGPLWAAIENQSPNYINITHTDIYIYIHIYIQYYTMFQLYSEK